MKASETLTLYLTGQQSHNKGEEDHLGPLTARGLNTLYVSSVECLPWK